MGKGSGRESKKKGGKKGKTQLHETGAKARSSRKAPAASTSADTPEASTKQVARPAGKREIMPWESLVKSNTKPGVTHLHQAYASARGQYLKASPQRRLEIHAASLGITIEDVKERLEKETAERLRRQAEEEKARLKRYEW